MSATLLPTHWIMRTKDHFYFIQPSSLCKPEDHARLNPHVICIENQDGEVLWKPNSVVKTLKESNHE